MQTKTEDLKKKLPVIFLSSAATAVAVSFLAFVGLAHHPGQGDGISIPGKSFVLDLDISCVSGSECTPDHIHLDHDSFGNQKSIEKVSHDGSVSTAISLDNGGRTGKLNVTIDNRKACPDKAIVGSRDHEAFTAASWTLTRANSVYNSDVTFFRPAPCGNLNMRLHTSMLPRDF